VDALSATQLPDWVRIGRPWFFDAIDSDAA
jgi:hypothetical protein